MFVQVITGTTSDAAGLRRQMDRWDQELRPGAAGYLGSTGGVTDDGRVFMAARFESEEAAQRNSAREEQGAWWAETEKFIQNPAFQDSAEVTILGPDRMSIRLFRKAPGRRQARPSSGRSNEIAGRTAGGGPPFAFPGPPMLRGQRAKASARHRVSRSSSGKGA